MKRFLGLFVFIAVTAGSALAQDQPPMPPPGGAGGPGMGMRFQMPTFADLDKNKDKKITKDEFQGPPQFFDAMDTNHDGAIDEEEFNAARARMGRGGMGGGPRTGESLTKLLDADHDGKVSRE